MVKFFLLIIQIINIVNEFSEKRMDKPLHVILSGFGMGLSEGSLFLEMGNALIPPMLYTDAFCTEGVIGIK